MSKKTFNEVMEKLFSIATADGIITEEEQEILDAVNSELQSYDWSLSTATSDGVISPTKAAMIKAICSRVVQKAKTQALKDGVLTSDEFNLLIEIYDLEEKEESE